MDLSVSKYKTQESTLGAGFIAPKVDAKAVDDAFFAVLNQTRVSKSADESSDAVFTKLSQKTNTKEAFKDTGKTTDRSSSRFDRSKQYENDPVSANKPKQTPKLEEKTNNGQKIPHQAKNAPVKQDATSEEQGADTTLAQNPKLKTPSNSDQQTENPQETVLDGKGEPVIKTQQTAKDSAVIVPVATTVVTQNAPVLEGQNLSVPQNPQSDVPETSEVQNTSAVKNLEQNTPELSSAEQKLQNALKQDASSTDTFDVSQVQTNSTTQGTQKTGVLDQNTQEAQQVIAPELQKHTSKKDASASQTQIQTINSVAEQQASKIAAVLPEGVNVAVNVSQSKESKAVKTPVIQNVSEVTEAVDEAVVPMFKSVETPAKTTQTANTNTPSIAPSDAQSSENARNSDANQQQTTPQNNASIVATQPITGSQNASSDTFASTLKATSNVEGVQGKPSALNTEQAQPSFNLATEGRLQGKVVAGSSIPQKLTPTNELVDQIKINITKAVKEGVEKININLKPKELGNIQISLEVDDKGNMKASIIASRAETLDMLQKDASILKQALNDAGLKTNDNAFSFSYRGEPQSGNEQNGFARNHSNQQEAPAQEQANASETNLDDLTEAVIASSWSKGRHALNIRV